MGEYFGSRCQGKRRGKYFFAIESGECGLQECSRTGGLCSKWKESCRKSKNVQSQGVYLRSGVSGFE